MEEFINEYVVGFIPTIIVDPVDTNIEFEGVKMMLNQSSNYTEFTYTELYTLMHVLETLNLSAAGASLMLLYMDWLRTKPAVRKTLNKEDSSKMDKILANVSPRIRGPHSAEELEKFKKEREEDGGSKNDASEQRNENH